jgi:hypothetical protein
MAWPVFTPPRIIRVMLGRGARIMAIGRATLSRWRNRGASLLPELGSTTPTGPAARASSTAEVGDRLGTVMDRTRLSLIALLLT